MTRVDSVAITIVARAASTRVTFSEPRCGRRFQNQKPNTVSKDERFAHHGWVLDCLKVQTHFLKVQKAIFGEVPEP
jgi:hypothetical protein